MSDLVSPHGFVSFGQIRETGLFSTGEVTTEAMKELMILKSAMRLHIVSDLHRTVSHI